MIMIAIYSSVQTVNKLSLLLLAIQIYDLTMQLCNSYTPIPVKFLLSYNGCLETLSLTTGVGAAPGVYLALIRCNYYRVGELVMLMVSLLVL